ncbi:MAG: Ig-like domain-containing protein [Verrucomicrobia bacterium]|nr:Ig-like domain-containing protein [Verrucomicrobiota bacterium]
MKASLAILASVILGTVSARAGSVTYNFDTDPTGVLDIKANANDYPWVATGGNPATGGFIALCYPSDYQNTHIVFPDLDPGNVVTAFKLECDLRIGNSQGDRPADGFSIGFARAGDPMLQLWDSDPGRGYRGDSMSGGCPSCENASLPETGTMTGIAISFDTWSGNTLPDGADVEGILVVVDNTTVLRQALPTRHGACADTTSLQTGPRDSAYWAGAADPYAPESWEDLCWQPLSVELDEQGKLTVKWKNNTILDAYQTTYFPTPGRVVMGGRTGGENEHTHIDNLVLTTSAVAGETEPPTVPGNLRATTVGARRVVLAWDPSEDRPDPRVRVAYELEKDGTVLPQIITTTTYEDRANLKPSSAHTYRVRAVDLNQNKSDWASVSVSTEAEVAGHGWLVGQIWDGFSGAGITDLQTVLADPRYPNTPDREAFYLRGLSFGDPGFGNTYGDNLLVRVAGTLTPQESGQYRFFVRSDDASYFFINPSGAAIPDAATAMPDAQEQGCCGSFEEPGQGDNGDGTFPTSEPISLTAGQKYGFLFLVKEGGGGDWGQVAWRMEGDTTPASQLPAISGVYIEPAGGGDPVGASVTITQQPQNTEVIANEPVTLSATATFASPWTTVAANQWYKDGEPVFNATSPSYYVRVTSAANSGSYKLLVSVPGAETFTSEATLTVTADNKLPTIVSVHGSDTFTEASVRFSEPVTDPSATTPDNYKLSGGVNVTGAARVDDYSVRLTTSAQAENTLYTLTVNGVKDNAGNSIAVDSKYDFLSFALTAGYLKFETWSNIGGTPVQNLLDDPRYPASPDFVAATTSFDTRPVYGDDSHENYGGVLSGYLTPTETADYDFFIRSDDASQLFISTDEKPENLSALPIAEETGCCDAFHEVGDAETTATPIHLEAGQKYFIKAIWKEGGGGDYCQVAWRKVGDPTAAASLTPIPGQYLSWYIDLYAGPVLIGKQPQNVAVAAGGTATFSVEVAKGERPLSYQWRLGSIAIPGATSATLVLNDVGASDAGSYSVLVSNLAGSVISASAGLILDGTFLIEAEDFNYDNGKTKAEASVMPYRGGAYNGLSAVLNVDYGSNDDNSSDEYRKGETPNKNMDANLGGQLGKFRGQWEMTVNFKLGWTDTSDWGNYTRAFPNANYQVLAAMSYDGRSADQLKGKLDLVTAGAATTSQTLQPLGKFAAPGSGGWGRNEFVRMIDDAGAVKVVALGGEQTVRFTMDSGDFDYLLFVPSEEVPPPQPRFTSVTLQGQNVIVEWTGEGVLEASDRLVGGTWTPLPTATSPFTITVGAGQTWFGRIRK